MNESTRRPAHAIASRRTLPISGAIALLTCLLAACSSIGPSKLVLTHEGYNDAVQLTLTREVLKNIVRERYLEPMQFITVSSINAQFSVSAGASVGATGIGGATATAGQTAANVGYSDSPTISFIPQVGAGFYKSLAAPISLEEVVAYVLDWGQSERYALEFTIGSINYSRDRPGPHGEPYRDRLDALVRLFEAGAHVRYFREFRAGHFISIPKDGITGADLADASNANVHFYEKPDGTVAVGVMRLNVGLVVPLPHKGQTESDLKLLGLTPGKSIYAVRPPGLARPEPLGIQPDTLWVTPRSVANILELAVRSVEVPQEHLRSGVAPPIEALVSTGVTMPMRILYSLAQPATPYRVRHRGYWFYIDDTDTLTKRLFLTTVSAYSSRIGSIASDAAAPQIVLPIGGG